MQTTAVASDALGIHSPRQGLRDRGLESLRSEDFMRILITELQQQDPLEPSNTSDMISDVSQIRSIELSGKLTKSLEELAGRQRLTGLGELIGKYVSALVKNADGSQSQVAGVVTGVRSQPDNKTVLELDSGLSVEAARVTWITTAEQGTASSATGTGLGTLSGGTEAAQAPGATPGTKPGADKPRYLWPLPIPLPKLDLTSSLRW
jgi:flagellar basal-body rod modification protein FlgD